MKLNSILNSWIDPKKPDTGILNSWIVLTSIAHHLDRRSLNFMIEAFPYYRTELMPYIRADLETEGIYTGLSVYSVAWSPNEIDSKIATGHRNGTIKIWNPETGEQIGEPLMGHTDVVWSLAWNLEGTRLASGSKDGTLRIWNLDSLECIIATPAANPMTGEILMVSWADSKLGNCWVCYQDKHHKDHKLRSISSGAGALRYWDPETGKQTGILCMGSQPDFITNLIAKNFDDSRIAFIPGRGIYGNFVISDYSQFKLTKHRRIKDLTEGEQNRYNRCEPHPFDNFYIW